jgi:nitroimidazol reductase NimA-like FMN-containing flavoprotein (pyridoxamine 5'-phosphate oxidase superfamily)
MKAEKLAQKLLQEVPVLHLATSDKNGKPSNCALEFVKYEGKLYWRSTKGSLHSKNLQSQSRCAICVTRTNEDGSGEGTQAYGKAAILKRPDDIENIRQLLDTKITKKRTKEVLNTEDTREYWMFVPSKTHYMNERVFGYGRILLTQSK